MDLVALNAIRDVAAITSLVDGQVVTGTATGVSFALLSDANLNSLNLLGFGSLGVGISSPLNFAFETNGPIDVSQQFLTVAARQTGYRLAVQSDIEAARVPDGGTTVSLLGLGLGGISFLRRKLA